MTLDLRRQTQTLFGSVEGNCLATCVGCLIEVDVREIPNFCFEYPGEWYLRLNEWLAERGLRLDYYSVSDSVFPDWARGIEVIAAGKSPRGSHLHSVIWKTDRCVWDPHPDRSGIESIVDFGVLVVRDFPTLREFLSGKRSSPDR